MGTVPTIITATHAKADVVRCSALLAEKGLTIAFAESATAGYLSFLFSLTPQSGDVLKGGITCYDACVKEDLLGVPPTLFERFTPESLEASQAIAGGLSRLIPADLYVGITGLSKLGGSETSDKPVGTMFTVVKAKDWLLTDRTTFSGTEELIIAAAASNLCRMLELRLT